MGTAWLLQPFAVFFPQLILPNIRDSGTLKAFLQERDWGREVVRIIVICWPCYILQDYNVEATGTRKKGTKDRKTEMQTAALFTWCQKFSIKEQLFLVIKKKKESKCLTNMFAIMTKLTKSSDILSTWLERSMKVPWLQCCVQVSSPGSSPGESRSKVNFIWPSLTEEKWERKKGTEKCSMEQGQFQKHE